MENKGIYIHIPFCRNKCNYCDFYVITNPAITDKFVNALLKEIQLYSGNYENEFFDSIFIGGGTPSLFSGEILQKIINRLKESFNISEKSEVTIESNPEDFVSCPDKLKEYHDAGINRLSIGIQSFDDNELISLTREHKSENIKTVLNDARNIFRNISIDLIYSIPGQSREILFSNLDKAIEFDIPHISAYNLIIEPETKLYHETISKKNIWNNDSYESELYQAIFSKLSKAGYEHYEISNYCKPGFKSIHNLKYWEYVNYIGLGPSSHSFFYRKRWNNTRNIIKYINKLKENKLPAENIKELSKEESILEFIMLGLRAGGINLNKFSSIFDFDFREKYYSSVEALILRNYGIMNEEKFRLTEKGYIIADEIVSRYF